MAADRFASSIPIPDSARTAAGDRSDELIDYWDLTDAGLALESDDPSDVEHFVSPVIDEILEAAAPKLYAQWAEQLVAEIRKRGTEWADPPDARGPLHEAISDRAGNFSSEFWGDQDVAEGCADFVAWLLGLGDRSS